MIIPIFMNNGGTHYVDCIYEGGKKYCEISDFSPKMFGVIGLCTVFYMIILFTFMNKMIDGDGFFKILLFIWILAPFLLLFIFG